jgi:hypothetical protein
MRGYVATVVGGLAGLWVGFVTWNYLFSRLLDMCSGSAWGIWPCTYAAVTACFLTALVGVAATCGLAAAASIRLARGGAALETGLAVVPLVGLYLLSFMLSAWLYPYGPWTPPLAYWVLFNGVLALVLVLARSLGVAWHRRRMKVREV